MKNEIVTACYQLITAGINGTLQGIAVTLVVAGGLRWMGRTNAATRHAVWFGTLLLVALLIPAHLLREHLNSTRGAAVVQESDSAPADPISVGTTHAAATGHEQDAGYSGLDAVPQHRAGGFRPSREEQYATLEAVPGDDQNTSREAPARLSVLTALDAAVVDQAKANERSRFLAVLIANAKSAGERLLSPISWNLAAEIPLPLVAAIPLFWMAITAGKIVILFRQLFRIRRLKRDSAVAPRELNALFHSLRETLGVRREVMLKVSREHRSPVVLGFLRPAILLPADARPEEVEHVLQHELAHVSRRDDWANLVQQFIGAAFFFHPAIGWISKRLSLEREIACDDRVLQSTGRPRAYALLLAALAGRLQPFALAPGVSTNQSQLKQRIDMILNTNRNTSPRLARARLGLLASMAAAVTLAALYLAPRVVFAQAAAPPPPAPMPAPAVAVVTSVDATPVTVSPLSVDVVASVSSDISPVWPVTPAPPVGPGPKFKPGAAIPVTPPALTLRGPVIGHAAPSVGPMPVPAPPAAGMTFATPAPRPLTIASADAKGLELPQPPRAIRRGRDSSLEERLDRLEKMVESLTAQQKNKPGQFEFHMKPRAESGLTFDRDTDWARAKAELDRSKADLQKQGSTFWRGDQAKLKESTERQAKMAAEQAKIAREAQQRASRDEQQRRVKSSRAGSRQELEALHRQHEMLERQMEKLDRQIEKLEREQERSEDEGEQDDFSSDQPEQPAGNQNSNGNGNNNSYNNQPAPK